MSATGLDLTQFTKHQDEARAACLRAIRLCLAKTQKPLKHQHSYADGFWGVEVGLRGELKLSGYALEYETAQDLEDLSLAQLANLMQDAETALRKALRP